MKPQKETILVSCASRDGLMAAVKHCPPLFGQVVERQGRHWRVYEKIARPQADSTVLVEISYSPYVLAENKSGFGFSTLHAPES
jgi:hypothetical protein